MPQVQILHIVVASPGDVQAERNALPTVIDELNSGIARDRGLRLELARWETDAFPGFHPEGPQELIASILRIEECDILIGIFWKRFGTPVKDAKSGTEHEFRRGYEAWKQTGRPQIMVYFNQRPYAPKTREETDQWGQVLDFQRNFPKEGLWWPYRGKAQFERLVRNHLTQFIRQQGPDPSGTRRMPSNPIPPVSVQQHGSGAVAIGPETTAAGEGCTAVGGPVYSNIIVGPSEVQRQLELMQSSHLDARKRVAAGNALAQHGDPRFRADAWYLPDEPLLGLVEIPAGPFLMGSDKAHYPDASDAELPQHEVTLPRYFIARYPVTVVQFQAFVEGTRDHPEAPESLQGLANHPVVYVSWYEALQYCDWLTKRLRAWPGTPEPLATLLRNGGWQVGLPSEAEWEKAARGTDGRLYPWGNEPDPDRANYSDNRINSSSAVGCFPGGASPYGVEDMSGNIWEWTRSLWGDYPYPTDQPAQVQRENHKADRFKPRVLRGGAFYSNRWQVRCASRNRDYPYFRNRYFGVRVVVLPSF